MVSHDKPSKCGTVDGPNTCRHGNVTPYDRSQTGALMQPHATKFVDRDGRVVEEGTPVARRKPDTPPPEVSESLSEPPGLTVAVDATTMPHRTGDTEKLADPPFQDSPAPRLIEPTTMLDAPTKQVESAELDAAPSPETQDFNRVEWCADRLAAVADALRVDKRRHTADLMTGAQAALCVGTVRGSLQKVASRLVQQALLADADVGVLDDQALAQLLFELAADVLVGVEPMRRASRELAHGLEERAKAVSIALERASARGDHDAEAEHRGRLDELTSQARTLRRSSR